MLAAFGTADIQLAPMTGNAHRLLAVGAVEIAVIPILQTGQESLPLAQFCPPCRQIAGQGTVQPVKEQPINQDAPQTVEQTDSEQGKQKIVDASGRVDLFKKKFGV